MAASEELGIIGLHSAHYFVHDAERSRHFYEDRFGWRAAFRSDADLTHRSGQQSTVYEAGQVRVAVSTPVDGTPRAARYLKRHPDGIGTLAFRVRDIDRAWSFLLPRGGTPIHGIERHALADGGRYSHFSITTAIGDVTFRFVQIDDSEGFAPGFEAVAVDRSRPLNPMGVSIVDHITCNSQTMSSVALWFEHVMGMEKVWGIEFHTQDVNPDSASGTGLRSVVYGDPTSGLKFPINEPLQPFFKQGQINSFIEDNWGAGVQHIALVVDDAVSSVRKLRQREVAFLATPGNYYDAAPARLAAKQVDVDQIGHKLATLRELGILIDGSPVNRYLIQIFLQDAATLYSSPQAGPFFYELIERCGDPGFGEGNFRALFESIERQTELDGAA